MHVRHGRTRTCTHALAVDGAGAGGSRTALDNIYRAGGLEENGAGPSGGGGEERGIFQPQRSGISTLARWG